MGGHSHVNVPVDRVNHPQTAKGAILITIVVVSDTVTAVLLIAHSHRQPVLVKLNIAWSPEAVHLLGKMSVQGE